MILALLMGATSADPTYDRLFGETPAEPTAVETAPTPSPVEPPEMPAWAVPVAVLAGLTGGVWWWRKRPVGAASRPLTVLQRSPIGDRSSLVLVEVLTSDGERRRLLVGTGTGVPGLVADLGGGFDDNGTADATESIEATRAETVRAEAARAEALRAANIAEEVLRERRGRGNLLAVAGDDE